MPKFSPGTLVSHEFYGDGVVKKVDSASNLMRYFLEFSDGTIVWFSKNRSAELRVRDGE